MNINNIHRDTTATVTTAPIVTRKLNHILRDETNATYLISSPRVGYYVPQTFKKFVETYAKQESLTPRPERVSKEGKMVKIWVRSYSEYSYMIETDATNMVA